MKNEALSIYSNSTQKEDYFDDKTNKFLKTTKAEGIDNEPLLHQNKHLIGEHDKQSLNTDLISNNNNKTHKAERTNYIDNFIDEAGYTKYHFHLFLINAIIFFMIGSEFVITNLLLSTLKTEWSLMENQVVLLSSALFLGILITSVLSGNINSNYGRRKPILIGCITLSTFSMLTSFADNFWIMLAIKVLVGIGIGTVIPSLTSLVTECIPNNNRSLVLNGVWGLYPLGIIYVCYVGIHFIKRNIFDWRTTCLINSLTGIPVCYFTFFLDESPRYLFLKVTSVFKGESTGDDSLSVIDENNPLIKKGFEILNKLGKSANKKLSDQDKRNIIGQLKEDKEKNDSAYVRSSYFSKEIKRRSQENIIHYESNVNYNLNNENNFNNKQNSFNNNTNIKNENIKINSSLALNKSIKQKTQSKFHFGLFFTDDNRFTSICLIFLWYLTSLISFGLLVILPKHYEIILKNDKSESLKNMILTMYIFFLGGFLISL